MKGNKPDYHQAMAAEQSKQFYDEFLAQLRKAYGKPEMIKGTFSLLLQDFKSMLVFVGVIGVDQFTSHVLHLYQFDIDGAFGAHMQVNIQNDGPVTITLESPPLVSISVLVDAMINLLICSVLFGWVFQHLFWFSISE